MLDISGSNTHRTGGGDAASRTGRTEEEADRSEGSYQASDANSAPEERTGRRSVSQITSRLIKISQQLLVLNLNESFQTVFSEWSVFTFKHNTHCRIHALLMVKIFWD